MKPIKFDFTLFQEESTRPQAEVAYLVLLEKLVLHDMDYLATRPDTPPVYESGVVARTYSLMEEHDFVDIPTALERKTACVDAIAAWRCAELRRQGKDAKIFLITRSMPSGGAWICLKILLPDGTTEDPFALCAHDKESKTVRREFEP